MLVTNYWRVSDFLFANQMSISSYPLFFHVTKDFYLVLVGLRKPVKIKEQIALQETEYF